MKSVTRIMGATGSIITDYEEFHTKEKKKEMSVEQCNVSHNGNVNIRSV